MVLVLLGILTAVAVPKYFDLQEESRLRAADAAIAEAQARINAYFGQQLLADGDCIKAAAAVNADLALPSGKIADATNAQGKVFGDVTLSIGKLLANGSPTLVTAYFDGKVLAGGPHGRLFLAKCTDVLDIGSALDGFGSIGNTGVNGAGVVGSYAQGNSLANDLVLEQGQLAFDALMSSLGWEGDVGYWRVAQNSEQTSVIWTREDISGITEKQRVPFIQSEQLLNGTTLYAVGLIGVVKVDGKGAMLLRDNGNGTPFGSPYGTCGKSNGYGPETNGYYVTGSADSGYSLSTDQRFFGSIEEAMKAYESLSTKFTGNEELRKGTSDYSRMTFSAS